MFILALPLPVPSPLRFAATCLTTLAVALPLNPAAVQDCRTECTCAQGLHTLSPNPEEVPECFDQFTATVLAAEDGCCGLPECPEYGCTWIIRVAVRALPPCNILISGPDEENYVDEDDGHAVLTSKAELSCGYLSADLIEVWVADVKIKVIQGICNTCPG